MLHIALHFIVPLLIGFIFYKERWKFAYIIMIATMAVDIDHLLADPIYDPMRCSINFHPLHTFEVIFLYFLMVLVPFYYKRRSDSKTITGKLMVIQLLGLGLIIHILLDALDCWI